MRRPGTIGIDHRARRAARHDSDRAHRRPRAWHDWFAAVGAPIAALPKAIHFDSLFAVARAAERGLGVALLPMPLSESWFAGGVLERPCVGELETADRYCFAHRLEVGGDPDVTVFAEWVTAEFATGRTLTHTATRRTLDYPRARVAALRYAHFAQE